MQLSMQQRDALLAGLALLGMAMENGSIVVDRSSPEVDAIGDLLTNGGEHGGLSRCEVRQLADMIVDEYPAPELAAAMPRPGARS